MIMIIDEKYMHRCLFLARKAMGYTYPNPLVGSVIVHQGKIIGEGWHTKAGEPHAEVNAITSVRDKSLLKESTLYVNLEPCVHFGKTPPCADLIIEKGIPRIVIGCTDIYSKVAGKGIQRLQQAGREVVLGVLEQESQALNIRFFTFHSQKRPYIILKWAQTRDGFIAPQQRKNKAPVWITNDFSQQLTHLWRAQEGAILVGKSTVVQDNPSLTTRYWVGNTPLRIVIDASHSLPDSLAVFQKMPTVVFTSKEMTDTFNVSFVPFNPSLSMPKQVCNYLYEKNVQSLIVEGGTQVLQQFINERLWDEARIFIGNKRFSEGVKAPLLQDGNLVERQDIQGDSLFVYNSNFINLKYGFRYISQ
jgi:riboflavin biosynthesis protein RibD